MKTLVSGAALATALLLSGAASAQVITSEVRIRATVSGAWVLDPRRCADTREDYRDSRYTTSRRDRREDRRDARIANCPASAYTFVPDAGQAPHGPIRTRPVHGRRAYQAPPSSYGGQIYTQPGYGGRVYQNPVPRYNPPASNYVIRNGRIIFTD